MPSITWSSSRSRATPSSVIVTIFRRLFAGSTERTTSPRVSSSVSAAVTSLRSMPVLRPTSAWLAGPHSSRAARSR
jgi:hypothetical protein